MQKTGSDNKDTLKGTTGLDVLEGRKGNDSLTGLAGNDTYIFNVGDGQDIINESAGNDIIRFGTSISKEDLYFSRSGNDLTICITGNQDRITVKNFYYSDNNKIEEIYFSDNSTLGDDETSCIDYILANTKFEDINNKNSLKGTAGNDVFKGNLGNDTITGLEGNDTYIFYYGDGKDRIIDKAGNDTIHIVSSEITDDDLEFNKVGNDLVIAIDADNKLTVAGWFSNINNRIENITIGSDETTADYTLTLEDDILPNIKVTGTSNADTLTGSVYDDNFISGGKGSDRLSGLAGNDTYYYEYNHSYNSTYRDGKDTIIDASGTDKIHIYGAGLTEDKLMFTQSGNNLVIKFYKDSTADGNPVLDTANQITISSWFVNDNYKIESITLGEDSDTATVTLTLDDILDNIIRTGTDGADTRTGTAGSDKFETGLGNDTIYGLGGNDTYVYNFGTDKDGKDLIVDSAGNSDTIHIVGNVTKEDLALSRSGDGLGNDLVITLDTDNSIKVKNWFSNDANKVENITFENPADPETPIDSFSLTDLLYEFRITGDTIADKSDAITSGSDMIIMDTITPFYAGLGGNDIYVYQAGNDTITDSAGNDTIHMVEKTNEDISFRRIGTAAEKNNLYILTGSDDTIKLTNFFTATNRIENITFGDDALTVDDEQTFTLDDILARTIITGTQADELIAGTAGNDAYYINTANGVDTILASAGEDTLIFGDIEATYTYKRDGNSLYKNDLYVEIDGLDNQVIIQNYFQSTGRIENIKIGFGGTVLTPDNINNLLVISDIKGTNNLAGTAGSDMISGGSGNDTISGLAGNDTYIYNYDTSKDGKDFIIDSGGNDCIQISGSNLSVNNLGFVQAGNNLLIKFIPDLDNPTVFDTNNQITVKDWFLNDASKVEEIFIGGDTITSEHILSLIPKVGSDGINDSLKGTAGSDYFFGMKGDDVLTGLAGNDTYLYRYDKTYNASSGDGKDTIIDAAGNDTIHIYGPRLNEGDVIFEKSGNNLIIHMMQEINQEGARIIDTNNHITVLNWFTSDLNKIENITFGNDAETVNISLDSDDIANRIIISGSPGPDSLVGSIGNDKFQGGMGNDTLTGYAGDDRYIYNYNASTLVGDGQDRIVDTAGNDTLHIVSTGLSSLDKLAFIKSGNDLVIGIRPDNITDTNDSITIAGWFTSDNNKIENITLGNDASSVRDSFTLDDIRTKLSTDEADTLYGTADDDIIYGKKGDDKLYGLAGNDTYSYNYNSGNDTVHDGNDIITDTAGNDVIYINDLNLDQQSAIESLSKLNFTRSGNDAVISFLGNDGSITIKNHFVASTNKIDYIQYGDDTAVDTSKIILGTSGNDNLVGDSSNNLYYTGSGNDSVYDNAGNDFYYMKSGNKSITDQGSGDDVYVYTSGASDTINDTISDGGGNDTVIFHNINYINYTKSENDLVFILSHDTSGSAGTLTIKDWFINSDSRIENFEFSSGTLTIDQIMADSNFSFVNGTPDNDYIYPENENTSLQSTGRDDYIYSSAGNDTIVGSGGNDVIVDPAGNDVYEYRFGDGADTIYDSAGIDKIRFISDSISGSITKDDIDLIRVGDDLIISIDQGHYGPPGLTANSSMNIIVGRPDPEEDMFIDSLVIKNWFLSDNNKIETVEFYDAGTDDSVIIDDFTSYIAGTSANDTITTNGTVDNFYVLQAGNDKVTDAGGNDTYWANKGNDTITDNAGNDIYNYERGDGTDVIIDARGNDTIIFEEEIYLSDLKFVKQTNDLYIDVIPFTIDENDYSIERIMDPSFALPGGIIIKDFYNSTKPESKIETIQFNNGLTIDLRQLVVGDTEGVANVLTGTTADNTYIFNGGDEDYDYDSDTYTITGGSGKDSIVDAGGNDTIIFTGAAYMDEIQYNMSTDGNDLIIQPIDDDGNPTNNNLTLKNWFISDSNRIETIRFDYGEDNDSITNFNKLIIAKTADTVTGTYTLNGTTGNDLIIGQQGNDYISGGAGDDVYMYTPGDGNDTISDVSGNDTIFFTSDLIYEDSLNLEKSGNNLIINLPNTYGGNESQNITLLDWYGNDTSRVEYIKKADGEIISIINLIPSVITGNDSANVLTGTAGRDTITALGGNDIVIAGAGDDMIYGGSGNDTYNYYYGDDSDTIIDTSGRDTLSFGDGILRGDIDFYKQNDNDDLYINIGDYNDVTYSELVIEDWFASADSRIENIEIQGSNTIISADEIDSLCGVEPPSPDNIYSYSPDHGDAVIDDFSGNDTIELNYPNITDNDVLSQTQDNPVLQFIKADNDADLIITQTSYPLDSITIQNWFTDISSRIETIKFNDDSSISTNFIDYFLCYGTSDDYNREAIIGSVLNDYIVGDSLDNVVYSLMGDDTVYGGIGNDYIYSYSGTDLLYGGDGDDRIRMENSDGLLNGGAGNDFYLILPVQNGSYTIMDSDGADVLYMGECEQDMTLDLVSGSNNLSLSGEISNIEDLETGNGNDSITGNSANNLLIGNNGNDTLYGGAGNDTLDGGNGENYLYGGADNDTYYICGYCSEHDWISDTSGNDTLLIYNYAITKFDFAFYKQDMNNDTVDDLVISLDYNGRSSQIVDLSSGVEILELYDGTYLTRDEINSIVSDITAYADANGITISSVEDVRNNSGMMSIISDSTLWHGTVPD